MTDGAVPERASAATRSSGPLRIGNASGFYGDRFSAMREMLTGGELDVLTGDYLAELTMLILGRDRQKDPRLGYAKTFLRQMEDCLGEASDRRVRIVVNAGGLNPAGLADALRDLAARLGLPVAVAHVEGDDLRGRAAELGFGEPLTANAYLGAWGITECLNAGADLVVTGRVTDASLVVGPAAAHFGWRRDDFGRLAGASVAGHLLECGTQVTGGNYCFFTELPDLGSRPLGFPIAEVFEDGSSVITKHPQSGGAVTTGTVTAQLLYEIGGPRYPGPDVTTRFDTVSLVQDGRDRVRISGTIGEPPPPRYKVSLNAIGGYRNEVEFVLTGLDVAAKAALLRTQLAGEIPQDAEWTLTRGPQPDADTEEAASVLLRCVVRSGEPDKIGRPFSDAAIALALASYPGFHVTAPPSAAQPYGVFRPGYVSRGSVDHVAVLPDGRRVPIEATGQVQEIEDLFLDPVPAALTSATPKTSALGVPKFRDTPQDLEFADAQSGVGSREPRRTVPLGLLAGARSGDKGGSVNIGVWARVPQAWGWLAETLTTDLLRSLLPETASLRITRYVLPNLHALNFVIEGLLGEGVAYQARFDPQGKGVGEWLRSRLIDAPVELIDLVEPAPTTQPTTQETTQQPAPETTPQTTQETTRLTSP